METLVWLSQKALVAQQRAFASIKIQIGGGVENIFTVKAVLLRSLNPAYIRCYWPGKY
jgi:phosphoribosylformimino-5-aminoimidazole carboxamide ribonucleotide (ProFAR) isomerase